LAKFHWNKSSLAKFGSNKCHLNRHHLRKMPLAEMSSRQMSFVAKVQIYFKQK
jgi:hypothetical protein